MILSVLWLTLIAIFLGSSGLYFLYTKRIAGEPWNLSQIDKKYQPTVAILVPVHNEEKTIRLKLRNLEKQEYPPQKTDIVIVNDASTDRTLDEIKEYRLSNPSLNFRVFSKEEHLGKTKCLNLALKSVSAEIVIVSDADCFWPSDILSKALPYLSDPTVGAITAKEYLLNSGSSWITVGEQFFDDTVQAMHVGESKIHSTIFFYGGLAGYKRSLLDEFDHSVDDSGTALNMVQKNTRTLLLPEVGFYTSFPTRWKNKLSLKIRRASQLQHLWVKSLRLLLQGELKLPKKIAVPQIFLFIFNPLIFLALAVLSVFVSLENFALPATLFLILLAALLIKRTRVTIVEVFQNNVILLMGLTSFLNRRAFKLWSTTQESRSLITEDALRQRNLL